jgi:ABC-type transporter Mla maintaining outer membrane lipid asymmetry ATPase subunit MlaF
LLITDVAIADWNSCHPSPILSGSVSKLGKIVAPIIEAEGLLKHYGDVVALDGLDLAVDEGRILGLLGPNGAGKTTAVSILTTLLIPDAGTARVAGLDGLTSLGPFAV